MKTKDGQKGPKRVVGPGVTTIHWFRNNTYQMVEASCYRMPASNAVLPALLHCHFAPRHVEHQFQVLESRCDYEILDRLRFCTS